MLQDFERGNPTEIEFINGYVSEQGRRLGLSVPFSTAMAEVARAISRGEIKPHLEHLARLAMPER